MGDGQKRYSLIRADRFSIGLSKLADYLDEVQRSLSAFITFPQTTSHHQVDKEIGVFLFSFLLGLHDNSQVVSRFILANYKRLKDAISRKRAYNTSLKVTFRRTPGGSQGHQEKRPKAKKGGKLYSNNQNSKIKLLPPSPQKEKKERKKRKERKKGAPIATQTP